MHFGSSSLNNENWDSDLDSCGIVVFLDQEYEEGWPDFKKVVNGGYKMIWWELAALCLAHELKRNLK